MVRVIVLSEYSLNPPELGQGRVKIANGPLYDLARVQALARDGHGSNLVMRKRSAAMSGQELCPLCGEGHVTDSVQMLEYEYKGQKTQLPSHYRQCDVCASDFAGMAEYKPWA